MSITQLPIPVLLTGMLLFTMLLALLIILTACSSAAAQRLVRLLESFQHLIHGTCQDCGRKTTRNSRRTRKG